MSASRCSHEHASDGRRGFTLIELLLALAVVSLLLGLLAPSLAGAREAGRASVCLSQQRQLILGWMLYAQDYQGRAMPLAEEQSGQPTYWWGAIRPGGSSVVDHSAGFLAPYLGGGLGERSAYECPAQPWGTYRAQPATLSPAQPTSTYGYNGYYLSPSKTPGWNLEIGQQRWKQLEGIEQPWQLFVFADTLLEASPLPRNTALLDPPELFSGGGWSPNPFPTTAFRHRSATITAHADGSARSRTAAPEWLTSPAQRIGSVGMKNGPHYVPDWTRWR